MDNYLRFVAALLFVLGLIALLAWMARRYGLGGAAAPSGGKRKRLRLVEAMPLDAKRRLVLVQRDDVEHLILLGAAGDLAIESRIPTATPQFARDLEASAEADDEGGRP
jgi:flagellar protein FliO/FliZ